MMGVPAQYHSSLLSHVRPEAEAPCSSGPSGTETSGSHLRPELAGVHPVRGSNGLLTGEKTTNNYPS